MRLIVNTKYIWKEQDQKGIKRIEEFQQQEDFKELLKTVSDRILFLGAVPNKIKKKELLEEITDQVEEDRLFFLKIHLLMQEPSKN